MTLIDVIVVSLIVFMMFGIAKNDRRPNKKHVPVKTKQQEDIERLRQMEEWDRISHGEHKNRQ